MLVPFASPDLVPPAAFSLQHVPFRPLLSSVLGCLAALLPACMISKCRLGLESGHWSCHTGSLSPKPHGTYPGIRGLVACVSELHNWISRVDDIKGLGFF